MMEGLLKKYISIVATVVLASGFSGSCVLRKWCQQVQPRPYIEPAFKGDRSKGLPIKKRRFPIENPLVVVESVDVQRFCLLFWHIWVSD